MTQQIGIRELKLRIGEVMRRVREDDEPFEITYRGRVIANLTPAEDVEAKHKRALAVWAEMDKLAIEIGKVWPKGVSAVEAVREQRREL